MATFNLIISQRRNEKIFEGAVETNPSNRVEGELIFYQTTPL